ncbi:hypothetical protein [Marisediminicola sp. LYQ134]|uniref:hypothetical protein n=1 Tax=unclassified Marisediminicola TaxID=2618316 RepID=UPI00398358A2
MQLGTRWSVGDEPPARLAAAVIDAVNTVEQDLRDVDTAQWRWTLTWLESLPVVELDDGTVIRFDPSTDTATTLPPADEDAEATADAD